MSKASRVAEHAQPDQRPATKKASFSAALRALATRDGAERGLRGIMRVGFVCLIAGMVVLTDSDHIYERVFLLTLFLPTLVLLALRPSGMRLLWRQSSAKWLLLLLAWSMLSLLWSDGGQTSDWIGRALGIFLFMYGCVQLFADDERRAHRLLFACGVIIALAAVVMLVLVHTQTFHAMLIHRDNQRLTGIGVLQHPNLISAAMSAAVIWLCTCPCERLWQHILRLLMIVALLVFIALTYSRSTWGALYVALVVIAACRPGRGARWALISLLVLGVAALLFLMPELTSRGWSARPAILEHAWALFLQHPWLGLGQATTIRLDMGTFVANHAHNTFAQMALQLGLPGLLMWVGIWLALGWQGWRHRHKPLGRLVLATWAFTTFMGQVDLPYLIDSPNVLWLVAWLPLAIMYSMNADKRPVGASADR